MDTDWEQVQLLFEAALEQPSEARRAFIEHACGDDSRIRDEVVSLILAQEQGREETLPAAWLDALARRESPGFSAGDEVAARYDIRCLLGQGGMGEVYEAWDRELSIPVALKILHLAGGSDRALKLLKLEGLLARSIWHPNVCRVYDLARHGEGTDAVWFLIMELLRGESLSERLANEGRLPLDRVLPFAEQMAAGLGAAHRAGIVHCDFKPSNVMLVTRDGGREEAVVTDFGIARAASRAALKQYGERTSAAIIGTPTYMAPEQMRGEDIGPAADIYALGMVLYEMVTGTLPFKGGSVLEAARRRLEEEAPSPRGVLPELDERWEAVILRCLARDPRQRFGRVEDIPEMLVGRAPVTGEARDLPTRAHHTLPAERDTFVGREMEIKELNRLLSHTSRLVTLVGAGGMGKTRLAVHYGWRSLGQWPGGVWFCDLTEARTLNGIASAVAQSLGVLIGRGDPLVLLAHAIASRGRCLVILDNFEQVVNHAEATLGRWLQQAAEARFVVTSRERLNLSTESAQVVESLSIEAGTELFALQARGLLPGLELTGSEAESAREIVRLVDGMPLAIELAAARMRMMSAAQIVAQMRKRFQLLTGGRSARHETLATTIDGSWELLTPWERAAWAQCAVFEGGFTLEAAEAVLDLDEWPEAPWVVDIVQSLVHKSLLRAWVPGVKPGEVVSEVRFGMYVSLQEYARMKLQEALAPNGGNGVSAKEGAEARHGNWYAQYGTDQAVDALDRHGGVRQRRKLERELDNLVAACRRALTSGNKETTLAAYQAASHLILMRGPVEAVVKLGLEMLAKMPGLEQRARVLFLIGWAELNAGQMEAAQERVEAALAIHRKLGDRGNESIVLGTLAILHTRMGRMEQAHADHENALAISREMGNRWREGITLLNLGEFYRKQGQSDEARDHFEASLVLCREVGNRRVEGVVLGNLGLVHRSQGRTAAARESLESALVIHREVGNRLSEGMCLNSLGCVYFELGNLDLAHIHFQAALSIHRETGNRSQEGSCIGNLGHLHFERSDLEDARGAYETALTIFREVGDPFGEGEALAALGALHLRQGRLEEAREALDQGETVVRRVHGSHELGTLLCTRAELEHRAGNIEAARAALAEAEGIAARIGAGQGSELELNLAKVRQVLTVKLSTPPSTSSRP